MVLPRQPGSRHHHAFKIISSVSDALTAFQVFPSHGTQRLRRLSVGIVSEMGEVAGRRSGGPTMSSGLPTRLVGREAELAVLRDAIAKLRAGTGGVVLVEGEPGIGKSSLVAAAAAAGQESGCTVLHGIADQVAHPLPLRLLCDCLENNRGRTMPAAPRCCASRAPSGPTSS
ncbi:AAA family ATPase [Streptomyces sp. NPDC006527]|uniref:AAA family ATPase n=1 Tax=Streptomyces sp. NPDC006527 TaxID=3364749 RepID=UPI0036C1B434